MVCAFWPLLCNICNCLNTLPCFLQHSRLLECASSLGLGWRGVAMHSSVSSIYEQHCISWRSASQRGWHPWPCGSCNPTASVWPACVSRSAGASHMRMPMLPNVGRCTGAAWMAVHPLAIFKSLQGHWHLPLRRHSLSWGPQCMIFDRIAGASVSWLWLWVRSAQLCAGGSASTAHPSRTP